MRAPLLVGLLLGSTACAPPWTAASQRLAVTCSGLFEGTLRFEAARDELSAEQLQLLDGLRLVGAKPQCLTAGMSCEVTIADAKASRRYLAVDGDPDCPGLAAPLISFASFDPFRQTLGCLYSKATLGGPTPTAAPDGRCQHGLFTTGKGALFVDLRLDAPGPRSLALTSCSGENRRGRVTGALTLPPDTAALATFTATDPAAAGPDGTCATLDYAFPQAATYQLEVDVAEGFLPTGDFFLRFR